MSDDTVAIDENSLAILIAEAEQSVDSIDDKYWHENEGQRVKDAIEAGHEALDQGQIGDLEQVALDALALHRDRLLGYPVEDLHLDPADALQVTWATLVNHGHDPDNLILPDDQTALEMHHDVYRPDPPEESDDE